MFALFSPFLEMVSGLHFISDIRKHIFKSGFKGCFCKKSFYRTITKESGFRLEKGSIPTLRKLSAGVAILCTVLFNLQCALTSEFFNKSKDNNQFICVVAKFYLCSKFMESTVPHGSIKQNK